MGGEMGATRVSQGRTDRADDAFANARLLEGAVEVDYEAAVVALRDATRRFTGLVRSIKDPHKRTRGLDWTLADTAAHVLLAVRYDLGTLTGKRPTYEIEDGDVWASGTKHNAALLRAEPERDPARLADGIDAVVDEFIKETRRRNPHDPAPVAGCNAMTVANLVGIILGEMIVHAYDIAGTIGRKVNIDPGAARLAVYATTPMLPLAVNKQTTRSLDVRVEMRIRGGRSFVIHLENGTARSETPGPRADVYISADPVACLLVGYGRRGPWSQALRGRMLAWGRRPAIALKLPTFFRNP